MSADRIRSSSSPVTYSTYSRANAESSSAPTPSAASNTAAASEAPRNNAYEQSGFDAAAPQSALATQPAPSVAVGEPAPTPAPNPHAQLDAMKTQMSLEEKKDFLKQFGVSDKHLRKAKPHEIQNAFNQIVDQLNAMFEPIEE